MVGQNGIITKQFSLKIFYFNGKITFNFQIFLILNSEFIRIILWQSERIEEKNQPNEFRIFKLF